MYYKITKLKFSFHSRQYKVMAPISKSPIMFRWKQVIQYMTRVTGDSVEQITVPILYYIRYQKNLICIPKTIGSPNKGVNSI